MDITPSTIYWIARLDGLREALCVITALWTIGSLIYIVIDFCENTNTSFKKSIWSAIFAVICLFGSAVFIPTSKEVAAMIVLPKIANNENVQKIGSEFCDAALNWLKGLNKGK
jgi:hypothetical protein